MVSHELVAVGWGAVVLEGYLGSASKGTTMNWGKVLKWMDRIVSLYTTWKTNRQK